MRVHSIDILPYKYWSGIWGLILLILIETLVQLVQSLSHVWLCNPMLPCPSQTPGACSNAGPLSQWCHPTISSSVVPFSSCLQSFPASGSFPRSQFFILGGQSIGVLASVLPMNIQDWFPLGWTGWISLQPKGLSRAFSNTTVQKHQCFGAQLSLVQLSNGPTLLLTLFKILHLLYLAFPKGWLQGYFIYSWP